MSFILTTKGVETILGDSLLVPAGILPAHVRSTCPTLPATCHWFSAMNLSRIFHHHCLPSSSWCSCSSPMPKPTTAYRFPKWPSSINALYIHTAKAVPRRLPGHTSLSIASVLDAWTWTWPVKKLRYAFLCCRKATKTSKALLFYVLTVKYFFLITTTEHYFFQNPLSKL